MPIVGELPLSYFPDKIPLKTYRFFDLSSSSPKPEHHQSGSGGSGLGFHSSGLGLNSGPASVAGGGHLLSAGAVGGGQAGAGGAPGGGIGDDLHTFKEALVLRPRLVNLYLIYRAQDYSRIVGLLKEFLLLIGCQLEKHCF